MTADTWSPPAGTTPAVGAATLLLAAPSVERIAAKLPAAAAISSVSANTCDMRQLPPRIPTLLWWGGHRSRLQGKAYREVGGTNTSSSESTATPGVRIGGEKSRSGRCSLT